ncbi:MAG: hypothetical protein GWN00_03275, partial [Aliifodinibius sp.]|nr:hypothetical protein [candidate division Zixibacteria bacterium]NIT55283.1 hypothetical protein [Fodinibius sp.]NIS46954.1 hypothetical protein [candidate division Zixibacteria bacterium]NIU15101.1 hypothetical protein [candidate division Zixibacteria bacterium]NIV07147.1 hypothetical protein [candidate division Zixibacteria bacterium]
EDVPAYSERDKAITFRDYTLYKDFVRDVLQFPLANVMTHGIIKGKLNMLGGENETLRNWQDNAVMYFSRGVMMWELYLSPEVLTDAEWDFLAAMMEWAYHYEEILLNTRFVGGNPYRKKTYGYFHEGKETSLLIIRNPFVAPQTITFTMTDLFLVAQDNSYVIEELYPCKIIHRDPLTFSRPVTIPLQGYEVKVLRLLPSKALKYALPAGIHLQPIERKKNEVTYRVFTNPLEESCADFAGEAWLTSLRLNNRKIKADEFRRLICKGNKFNRTYTEYRF